LPSQALQDLRERLGEIDQLLEAHGALTRLKKAEAALQGSGQSLQAVAAVVSALVSAPGPGRPAEVQAINKAAIALLSGHLQGYVEDVFEEVARALLHEQVPDIGALIRQAPTRRNPNWDNISRVFAAVGFGGVLDDLSWQNCSNATLKARLREFNELRNRIVHGKAETVRKQRVKNYIGFVRSLATRLDRKLARRYRQLVGEDPW
jgi:hypothetical protein